MASSLRRTTRVLELCEATFNAHLMLAGIYMGKIPAHGTVRSHLGASQKARYCNILCFFSGQPEEIHRCLPRLEHDEEVGVVVLAILSPHELKHLALMS